MERLSKEEYNRARDCLKRYNYNCIKIINIQSDILSLSIAPADGLPKAPYSVGNPTLKKAIQLEENKELQQSIKEYKAVVQALLYINDPIVREMFIEEYQKGQENRWKIIEKLNISEASYKRKKQQLIYAVNNELKNF